MPNQLLQFVPGHEAHPPDALFAALQDHTAEQKLCREES
jgi:hypothetical protein